jgi:hypothetical protein
MFGIRIFSLITLGFFSISTAKAIPSGCGCTKGIDLTSITFTLTTKTALGNEVKIKDPGSVIIGYIKSKAQGKATEAATKKWLFVVEA